jgi:hypothetical protein
MGDMAVTIPARTVENARRGLTFDGVSADDFRRRLRELAWFARLGEPSPWDDGCVRISDWSEWPGPDDERVAELAEELQSIHDAALRSGDPRVEELFTATRDLVLEEAARAVPFDPDEDAYHAPTQSVWDAAYCAGVIACYLHLGWPIPDDGRELWAWYEAGHWPCGFADPPETKRRRLLVY